MQVVSLPLYDVCTACWRISVCPLTPCCKTFYYFSDFYAYIGNTLSYEITLTERLEVPNSC